MIAEDGIFLGFDPGGEGNFGVALLQGSNALVSTCGSIGEAVSWALTACRNTKPLAAGIDTLLHWSTGNAGWRNADRWLRDKYPEARNSVVAPNSLYGAMTIGGMGLAIELRRCWAAIRLNETHPKMLYHALAGARYKMEALTEAVDWFGKHSNLTLAGLIDSDHQLDALLSAWATREGYGNGWQDLAESNSTHIFPAGQVNYLWPSSNHSP